MITLGITGHRPKILGYSYDLTDSSWNNVRQKIIDKFEEIKPSKIISGMALGVDQVAAQVARELAIPYIAAVPFKGQESRWPVKSRQVYDDLLSSADRIVIVGELAKNGINLSELMFLRNKWIIDNSDELLAVWKGERKGGTFSAVNYAEKKPGYKIHVVCPI